MRPAQRALVWNPGISIVEQAASALGASWGGGGGNMLAQNDALTREGRGGRAGQQGGTGSWGRPPLVAARILPPSFPQD